MAPATVGPYSLLERIGSGGMGEVYRARDPRLGRIVALKLLPPGSAADTDLMARFEREARAASALNHPHIVSIFEAGTADGTAYIAMELLDGVPLDDWVASERPARTRVLEVFVQIADALARAHQASIVHRDVKPSNVLVSPEGYAKLVDFGLARSTAPVEPDGSTVMRTRTGVFAGTPAYMSPEQALGRPLDGRTDVFSLGIMLYEALAGRHPFARGSSVDTVHAILHAAPPPLGTPAIDWVLGKALAKEREQRYQDMREFVADLRRLRALSERHELDPASHPAAAPRGRSRVWRRAAIGGALAAGIVAAAAIWPRTGTLAPPRVVRLEPLTSDAGFEGEPTFSPDGKLIAYVSDRNGNFDIYLKRIDGGPDLQLTNSPADDVQPAFSPDGSEIAFVSGRGTAAGLIYPSPQAPLVGGDIYVMPALGGDARRVATGNFPAWLPDGSAIVFSTGRWFDRRLMRIAPAGGAATPIPLAPVNDRPFDDVVQPAVSPDGRWIAFTSARDVFVVAAGGGIGVRIGAGRRPAWMGTSLVFTSTEGGLQAGLLHVTLDGAGRPAAAPRPITIGPAVAADAAVTSDGRYVAFAAEAVTANVEALPFDAEAGLPLRGAEPRPLTSVTDAIYFYNLSPDGRTLVYQTRRQRTVLWRMDLGGRPVPLPVGGDHLYSYPRWSPDGGTIAFSRGGSDTQVGSRGEMWLVDRDGSNPRPLGSDQNVSGFFAWRHDGKALIYQSARDRQFHEVEIATGRDRALTAEPKLTPLAVPTRDARWLIVQSTDTPGGLVDIKALPLGERAAARVVASTPGDDYHPLLSPSERWLFFLPDHRNLYRVPGPAQDWREAPPVRVTSFTESGLFIEDPQLSADGRLLLYARRRMTADLWLLELESGGGTPGR